MNNDFKNNFMSDNNRKRAEENLDSTFNGDGGGIGDSFTSEDLGSSDFGNSFQDRFSNDDLGDSFEGNGSGSEGSNDSKFGIFKGIVGALIATKLFSMIDKNGRISSILGINNPGMQTQQSPEPQASSGENVTQPKADRDGGILSGLLSLMMILVGVGIILVFVFYVISFFLNDNLRPNAEVTGTNVSSDLSPWVNRLMGKRNTELKIMPNQNIKGLFPYRYDEEKQLLYIYFDEYTASMPFEDVDYKRYEIDKLDKSGYLYVLATKKNDGTIIDITPVAVYDENSKEVKDSRKDSIEKDLDEDLKGLGITKKEYSRIKELKEKGIAKLFKPKSESTPRINNIDDLTNVIDKNNRETELKPSTRGIGDSQLNTNVENNRTGADSQLKRFDRGEIIVKPAGEGGYASVEEAEEARRNAEKVSAQDEIDRINKQYELEKQQAEIDKTKEDKLREVAERGNEAYKDQLQRDINDAKTRKEIEELEKEKSSYEEKENKNPYKKEKIIVKEAGKEKAGEKDRSYIKPADPDRTGTDRLIPKYK